MAEEPARPDPDALLALARRERRGRQGLEPRESFEGAAL